MGYVFFVLMDTYQPPTPSPTIPSDGDFFARKRNARQRMLIGAVLGIVVVGGLIGAGILAIRKNTDDRSKAALDSLTAPLLTSGVDGCFGTVASQNGTYVWSDTCEGRASTDALIVPTATASSVLTLLSTTTGSPFASQVKGGATFSPVGVENYTASVTAPQTAKSVTFELNGSLYRVDSEAPFTLTRNEDVGYAPLSTLKGLRAGINYVQMTYFTEKEATGSAIKQETAVLSVQSRGTDRACEKVATPLFANEITKYKQWLAQGGPLQVGCPGPVASVVSTTQLPILGCSSVCTADTECNGVVVTLVAKKAVGVANAVVLENITVNGNTIEEDGKELTYKGAWIPYISSTFHNGKGIVYSITEGSSVSFYASGSYAAITTDTGPNRVGFDVYIDGVKQNNTGLENLTVAGNGNASDLSNYKLKTVALGLPVKPSLFSCSDVSGTKMCRVKNAPTDARCVVPSGVATTVATPPPSVVSSPLCNTACTSEITCDGVKVYLVPKYLNDTAKYVVLDKIVMGSTTLEEDSPDLTYFNAWASYGPVAGYLDGNAKIRYAAGIAGGTSTWISFIATAPSFTIYTDKGFNRSGYNVYIDGTLVSTPLDNLYLAGTTYSAFQTQSPSRVLTQIN